MITRYPLSDSDLDEATKYFKDEKNILLLVDFIRQSRHEDFTTYNQAEIENAISRLKQYPDNWVIGQTRDVLIRTIEGMNNG